MEQPLFLPRVAWSSCLLCDPDELVWTMSKRCHVPTFFLQDTEQAALGSPASWHVSSRLHCSVSNPQEGKARQLLFHFPRAFCLFYFLAQTKASPTFSEPSEKNNPLNVQHQGLYLQPGLPSDLVSLHPSPTDILLLPAPTPCSTP